MASPGLGARVGVGTNMRSQQTPIVLRLLVAALHIHETRHPIPGTRAQPPDAATAVWSHAHVSGCPNGAEQL